MADQTTQRPTLASVVAIIGLIYGSINLCGGPPMLAVYFVDLGPPTPMTEAFNTTIAAVKSNQVMFFFTIVAGVMGLLLSIIEVVGCIGLLRMKPWGRPAVMFYAVGALLLLLLSTGINIFTTILPSTDNLPELLGSALGVGLGCLSAVIPIGFLIALTQPEVVEAYRDVS